MRSLTLCSVLLLVAGAASAKDLAIHQRFTPAAKGVESYDSTEYLTPSLRIVDGPYSRTIIDAKARTVTVIDKDEKTFWQTSFDSLRRQTTTLKGGSVFDPTTGAGVTLAATGTTETIAGHPCEEHVLQGGTPAGFVCIAKDLQSPADPELWKDWTGLGTRLGDPYKVRDAVGPTRVALQTSMKLGNAGRVTIVATAVREESPDPELTKVPEGYTRATRFSQQR